MQTITNIKSLSEDSPKDYLQVIESIHSDLNVIYEFNPDPIFYFDDSGCVVGGNKAAFDLGIAKYQSDLFVESIFPDIKETDFREFIAQRQSCIKTISFVDKIIMFRMIGIADLNIVAVYGSVWTEDMLRADRISEAMVIKNNEDKDHTLELLKTTSKLINQLTQHKTIEDSKNLLSKAVEVASESIIMTDAGGKIVYVNPAFERVTGYSASETIGKNPKILNSGKQNRAFYDQMWETLRGGGVFRSRFINRKKDGSLFEEEATITPIKDENGNVMNYIAVKYDVTQEVRLEEQLRHAQKMETVGRLAGGIAHDFNNIITVISGNVDMTNMLPNISKTARKHLEEIQSASDRATELVKQLLAFSRKQILKPRVVNMNDVINSTASMMRTLIGENTELKFECDPTLDQVKVDQGQIEQVIMNLVVNAKDAISGDGVITISTANEVLEEDCAHTAVDIAPGRYVTISVRDNGCGMTEEVRDKIFEPFYTTKEEGKGTGLGLSTVYGIVKQSRGYVRVYSELNVGTTFKVHLPVFEAERPVTAVVNKTKKILKDMKPY